MFFCNYIISLEQIGMHYEIRVFNTTSTIYQLYGSGQCNWLRNPEKAIYLPQVTAKFAPVSVKLATSHCQTCHKSLTNLPQVTAKQFTWQPYRYPDYTYERGNPE